ncbi:MAG: 3-keto-disaccharide hydrolase [Fimbriiglobus sp.]
MRRLFAILLLVTFTTFAYSEPPKPEKFSEDGFVSIFDGKSLKGWNISAKTGHSNPSKNKSGGKWVIEDGAIIGSQDIPGNGGIIITEKEYTDFEVAFDMKNDYGPDSGLFLRSNDKGQAYQAMIDYHANGNLMGIYGEGLGGFISKNYSFKEKVTDIVEEKNAVPLPVKPEDWPAFWKHGEWNELRARVQGQPVQITTWINGVKFMEWKETRTSGLRPEKGGIALQVHGGGDFTKQFVRYKNIRVKELK